MRILHLVASMDSRNGGLSQAVRTMATSLSLIGVDSDVVCMDDAEMEITDTDVVRIYRLGPALTAWSFCPKLKHWLTAHLSEYNIVIVHGIWQYYGWALYKALKKLGTGKPKCFVMPHGMLDPYFQIAPERKLKAIRNRLFYKFFERKIINTADGMLFTCAVEKELAKEPFTPYLPKSAHVIGLAVSDPPLYTVNMKNQFLGKCPEVSERPYLLYLGRIHEKKGVDNLIQAYVNLKEEGLVMPQLVIAGPGLETPYGKSMIELAKGHNDIIFPGMLTGQAKWGAYYGCEAFLLPSHQENFGIAIVEAMACGKPVFISNKVNIWKEIRLGHAGLIMSDTLEGTVCALKEWMDMSKESQLELGLQAYKCYKSTYTLTAFASEMEVVFNSKPNNVLI